MLTSARNISRFCHPLHVPKQTRTATVFATAMAGLHERLLAADAAVSEAARGADAAAAAAIEQANAARDRSEARVQVSCV